MSMDHSLGKSLVNYLLIFERCPTFKNNFYSMTLTNINKHFIKFK